MFTARPAVVTAAFATALVLAACGAEEPGTSDPEPPVQTEPDPEDTETEDPGNGDDPADEQPDPGAGPVDEADLPGEPIELFYAEGDLLDVVGVEHHDVLYVRQLPDPDAAEVTALDPMTEGVATTGRTQQVDSGIWLEMEAADQIGWASTQYLAYLGLVTDLTSEITDPGPQDSMANLSAVVVDQLTRTEDGPLPEVTLVHEDDDGDPVTRVLDVQEGGDDSIGGQRLRIVAENVDGEYVLTGVESTQICLRGTTEEGCL